MVRVKCENGKFLIKGTFDMGIAGVFENKEYGEGNIELDSFNDEVEKLVDQLATHVLNLETEEAIKTIDKIKEAMGDCT